MMNVKNVTLVATMLFGVSILSGCQVARTGSSTYAGTGFGNNLEKGQPVSRITVGPRTNIEEEEDVSSYNPVDAVDNKAGKKKKAKKAVKKTRVNSGRKAYSSRKNVHVHRAKKGKYRARRAQKGSRKYDALIRRHARANGIPYALARAVVQVESGFRAGARGKAGEVGLMQVRSRTARGMGYRGSVRGLYKPETNIKYGMRYLGKAYRLGGRSTCGAILKYNAGHGAKRMNPISRRYCNKVRRIIKGKV